MWRVNSVLIPPRPQTWETIARLEAGYMQHSVSREHVLYCLASIAKLECDKQWLRPGLCRLWNVTTGPAQGNFSSIFSLFFFLQSSPFWQMDSVHPLVCFPVGTLLLFQFWTETLGMSGTDQSEGRGVGRAQTCYEGRLESCSARRARLLHAFLRLSDLKVTSGGQFRACAHTHTGSYRWCQLWHRCTASLNRK